MFASAPFAIKVCHNIFGFSFVLTLFGFQLSRFLQMSDVSRSKRVVLCGRPNIAGNVPPLGEVAKFGTDYFLLKIIFLAKRKREFTTKFAILPNGCYGL
jgi:hypothetical protein